MKPKDHTTTWPVRAGRYKVFTDDLEAVIKTLENVGTVRMETNRDTDVTIEDLLRMTERPPKSIWIGASFAELDQADWMDEVLMKVELAEDKCEIWTCDERIELAGAAERLQRRLEATRSAWWQNPVAALASVAALGISLVLLLNGWPSTGNILVTLLSVAGLGALTGGLVAVAIDAAQRSGKVRVKLFMMPRNQYFWIRKREDIYIGLALGLVFFVAGVFATLILQSLT